MALRDLPRDYEPQAGDLRSESLLDGANTFKLDLYTGTTWAALHPVSGDELAHVTEGAENLGRRKNEETGHLAYYWRCRCGQAEPVAWWTSLQTPSNACWQAPRYGLGELVWLRDSLTGKPKVITGVILIEAYQDTGVFGEDEDLSSPQSWEYRFADGEFEEESRLMGRAELVMALARMPVQAVQSADAFDPFLDELDGNSLVRDHR